MSIEPAPSPPSADPRTVTLPPNGRTPANGDPTPHGSAPTLEAPGAALGAAVPFGRDFGDYELLEEIARGGMGVIFKARQKSLQRVVALKMILAGQLASPEQVRRFHFEAEQAAALDHPNIVPIYQVGEIFGQHYFSMKLVEGGSLATRMPELRKDLQTGVRVLVQVARAVHYAHQRGVLHRDLKPSNILLEGKAGSGNPPVPHVADFGLAKHLNATPGGGAETQSGAVVGTPGYVAPEQASARKDLTTAVDVYSLGAILYELLTGRPPFQAASPLDTLLLAMEKDPVRPRSLAPGVPRDLETICLTCLAKEPARRYASADALANDLERFLKGEPIRARPIGFFERAVKWAKRRPAAAALVGVSALAILALTVGGWWYNAQLHVALQVAEDRRKEAEENNARAERNLIKSDANFAKARDAVDKLLTHIVEGRLSQIRNMEGVRKEFLQEALAFYKEFLNEKSDDPAIRQEAGRAYRRVGDVKRLLKEYTKGEESYKEALRLQEKLAADFPREPAYREDQSLTLRNLAELLKAANRPRDAEEVYRKAEALLGSLVDEFPEVPDYRQKLAINYHWLALLLKGEGWREESVKAFREALRLQERLAADHPAVPTYHAELATTRHNLGQVLATPRPTEAVGVRLVPTTSAPFGLLAFACSAAAPDFLLDGCQGPDRRAELVAALELYRGACDAQREALRLTPTSAPYRSTLRLSDYSQLFATLKRLRDHSLLDQLDQRAECRLGVEERDGGPARARAWLLVDGSGPRGDGFPQGVGAAVDAIADVVQPLTSALEELGDR